MENTMIQIRKGTAERLKQLKDYNRQSYDELINKLLQRTEDDALTDADIKEIKLGLDDIKAGRTRPIEKVAKGLGITLRG